MFKTAVARGWIDEGRVTLLRDCRLFHTPGISSSLANHSKYERNYLLEAFEEALSMKPENCVVGLDFNYRATLWNPEQCKSVMAPLVTSHIDVLIATIKDMPALYGIGCGKWTPEQIDKGDMGDLTDEDIKSFSSTVGEMFKTKMVAVTIRYPDTFEQHHWEAAARDEQGHFFRSPTVKPITLLKNSAEIVWGNLPKPFASGSKQRATSNNYDLQITNLLISSVTRICASGRSVNFAGCRTRVRA